MRQGRLSLIMLTGIALGLAGAAQAQKAIDLPGNRFFPESVTGDGKGTAYVPSAQGGVYKVRLASGLIQPWIKPGDYGSASVFGVFLDRARQWLWTCNNDLTAQGIAITGADKGAPTVKAFDLKTGKGMVSLTLPGTGAFCNDLTVAKDGTVYVSDSGRSHILRWQKGQSALEDWFFAPVLADPTHDQSGLDGIDVAPDGSLYVNNWRTNILARVTVMRDGKPGAVTMIQTSRPLETPDAIRFINARQFALAEGTGKVALVTLAGDKAQVKTLVEGLSSAAGVTRDGKALWHVAGLLSYVFNAQKRLETPPLPFRLAPISLP